MEKKFTAINLRITQPLYIDLKKYLESLPYHTSMTAFILKNLEEKLDTLKKEKDGNFQL